MNTKRTKELQEMAYDVAVSSKCGGEFTSGRKPSDISLLLGLPLYEIESILELAMKKLSYENSSALPLLRDLLKEF